MYIRSDQSSIVAARNSVSIASPSPPKCAGSLCLNSMIPASTPRREVGQRRCQAGAREAQASPGSFFSEARPAARTDDREEVEDEEQQDPNVSDGAHTLRQAFQDNLQLLDHFQQLQHPQQSQQPQERRLAAEAGQHAEGDDDEVEDIPAERR